ncbi:MAG: hypothetical protein K2V38_20835, partial [Gemmataceae bacterium]|nr:hypothetical protein [Gemmataceae bacterium]
GKGFYTLVVDPSIGLYDLTAPGGRPAKGVAVVGYDNQPLRGVEALSRSVSRDVEEIQRLTAAIAKQRELFDLRSEEVRAYEQRLLKMNVIRDSVQAELFYLSTVQVGVYETRATVLRREEQLRRRLKTLGLDNP